MASTVYRPSPRKAAVLAVAGLASLTLAFYLRYRVVEPAAIVAACEVSGTTLFCGMRRAVVALFVQSVFGWVSVGAALLNLIRPSIVLLTIGLIAAAFGLVLYNTAACALAVPLLVLSLARRAAEPE